jgi:hypothetical protein
VVVEQEDPDGSGGSLVRRRGLGSVGHISKVLARRAAGAGECARAYGTKCPVRHTATNLTLLTTVSTRP